jgi:hypothetical protein
MTRSIKATLNGVNQGPVFPNDRPLKKSVSTFSLKAFFKGAFPIDSMFALFYTLQFKFNIFTAIKVLTQKRKKLLPA